ncbi:Potassium voltage-gated channel subfamily C member 1 [Mactra antiquata]
MDESDTEIDSLTIIVGWKMFKISIKAATSIPDSLLAKIGLNQHGETVFERDPKMFRFILNAHTTGILHAPRDVCPCAFREEMNFWKIPLKIVAPCCWKTVHENDKEIETLKLLIKEEDKLSPNTIKGNKVSQEADAIFDTERFLAFAHKDKYEKKEHVSPDTIKTRLWLFLEEPGSSTAAKIWYFVYITLVVASVVLIVIWAEPFARVNPYFRAIDSIEFMKRNSTLRMLYIGIPDTIKVIALTDPHPALFGIDVVCMFFFTMELFVHFCASPNKRKYFNDIFNVTKFVVCVTMIIAILFEINKHWFVNEHNPNILLGKFYFACKSMNALRLLLLFRLRKLYNGLHILLLALEQSLKEFFLLAFSFGIAVIMFGCLIFSAEIESDMFPSTQISMWWALITMTTIGYGDYFPTTTYGYMIGSLCAISGVIVIALPVASIAGTFSDLYSRNSDLQRHKRAIKDEKKDV